MDQIDKPTDNLIIDKPKPKRVRKSKKDLVSLVADDDVLSANINGENVTFSIIEPVIVESITIENNTIIVEEPILEQLILNDELSNDLSNEIINDKETILKKRGRKPKGGKIIQQLINEDFPDSKLEINANGILIKKEK